MLIWLASTIIAAPELGAVQWLRDFDAATEAAARKGAPVLVLFDEVPGCSTCVRYGRSTLSHPLLVEAAESLFVPVAIYNNRGGADRKVLRRYQEPTWNNPVVRIVSAKGKNLVPRLAGDYRPSALAQRMAKALRTAGQEPPQYLKLLAAEGEPTVRAYLSMPCFWSGEACVGRSSGVVATRTGWMGGSEVVEVELRASELDSAVRSIARCGKVLFSNDERAVKAASRAGLAARSVDRFRPTPQDDLHTLTRTPLAQLPLTSLQRTRLNSALYYKDPLEPILSPGQRTLLRQLRAGKAIEGGPRSTIAAANVPSVARSN